MPYMQCILFPASAHHCLHVIVSIGMVISVDVYLLILCHCCCI